jgi:hypothetical protein
VLNYCGIQIIRAVAILMLICAVILAVVNIPSDVVRDEMGRVEQFPYKGDWRLVCAGTGLIFVCFFVDIRARRAERRNQEEMASIAEEKLRLKRGFEVMPLPDREIGRVK